MGVYGSPQLGAFANDNKKPKPKSPPPWGVLIIASERAIRKDIHFLNDEVDTLIAVMEAKGILPKVEGQ